MELWTPEENDFDSFQSHTDKSLRVHLQGVLDGAHRHDLSPVATVAALFHDLGKLNPHFQAKLSGKKTIEYSKHSYLSALAFAAFCKRNKLSSLGFTSKAQKAAVLAIICRHHGHLPNMNDIFSLNECEAMSDFLASHDALPVSEFLAQWLPHENFKLTDCHTSELLKCKIDEPLTNPLEIFFQTQWAFASLIESDKRDAGSNKYFQRESELETARTHFSPRLQNNLNALEADSDLNKVRTAIRKDAVKNLREGLQNGERTFSLTAPTGAGKTLMLLALADEIRVLDGAKNHTDYSVTYVLPFLSITEQVEKVCAQVFGETLPITRADSRTQNPHIEKLLEETDGDPQKQSELIREQFAADTFDHAFIVTTFVQFCETLMSNRNARLLKLPNFARTIFLLDEIQALPPRLYTFFAAHLHEFCERFNCYVVFSTATMPALEFANKCLEEKRDPKKLFPRYKTPRELAGEKHFDHDVFDRYLIRRVTEWKIKREALTQLISQEESCLVVVNTIEDSRCLYELLIEYSIDKVLLLNTHFTPRDRRAKLEESQNRLANGERVILVSTQLIEAGVDIDFPVVFRDLCPLPNLIQCAGRCNRNGKLKIDGQRTRGTVWFFELTDDEDRSRAELIYGRGREPEWFLGFSREKIADSVSERELLTVQREYFDKTRDNLSVGQHGAMNLIEEINALAFKNLGEFSLIDDKTFGEERRYFVPDDNDGDWEKLEELAAAKTPRNNYNASRTHSIKIETQLRAMSDRVVTMRVKRGQTPPPASNVEPLLGLLRLANSFDYSFENGLCPDNQTSAII